MCGLRATCFGNPLFSYQRVESYIFHFYSVLYQPYHKDKVWGLLFYKNICFVLRIYQEGKKWLVKIRSLKLTISAGSFNSIIHFIWYIFNEKGLKWLLGNMSVSSWYYYLVTFEITRKILIYSLYIYVSLLYRDSHFKSYGSSSD